MPVLGGTSIVSPGFRRRPVMPDLPSQMDAVLPYLRQLDAAYVDAADEERRRLQVFSSQRDTASFGAADTTKVVTFGSAEPDADYLVPTMASWNATIWITSLTATGFTINASAAPGGAGGTVKWVVTR